MTSHDDESSDDLAPVTPLFGVRGARSGRADPEPSGHPARGIAPAEGLVPVVDDERVEAPDDGPRRDPVRDAAAALAAVSEHWSDGVAAVPAYGDEAEEPREDLDAQRTRAENVSLHALSRRGVSSSEMAALLEARDLDPEVVADEVSRLEGVGLLNDRELAENLLQTKQGRKGLGRGAVTSELRSRGIDASVIEGVLAETDDADEQARADEWAEKRAGSLRGLDRATAERRLNGYLMRRGYRSDTVRRAVEKALPRGGSSRGGVRFE
ncbi:RecX family transcriptional regulator [Frigoribacterium sp. ACAM 257]|uniref:regulatory protein RecX n=1 Tax=Frigoribacterium sp. ACAM 257 TaxID=2508998 RepID=UPI0011B9A361|nr:regulatory protein RecX [Frigoribacterium sp. ACAM 257]TWX34151.1 RecX family transcriptional regulator [Frigoribacterium sp. ACAM 257]